MDTQPKKTPTTREILFVKDQESAFKLADFLRDGWKLDPFLPVTRLENAAIFPLIKPGDDLLQCDPRIILEEKPELKPNEFADIALTADLQHGEKPQGEGWIIHAIYQKNVIWKLTQLKKEEAPKP